MKSLLVTTRIMRLWAILSLKMTHRTLLTGKLSIKSVNLSICWGTNCYTTKWVKIRESALKLTIKIAKEWFSARCSARMLTQVLLRTILPSLIKKSSELPKAWTKLVWERVGPQLPETTVKWAWAQVAWLKASSSTRCLAGKSRERLPCSRVTSRVTCKGNWPNAKWPKIATSFSSQIFFKKTHNLQRPSTMRAVRISLPLEKSTRQKMLDSSRQNWWLLITIPARTSIEVMWARTRQSIRAKIPFLEPASPIRPRSLWTSRAIKMYLTANQGKGNKPAIRYIQIPDFMKIKTRMTLVINSEDLSIKA